MDNNNAILKLIENHFSLNEKSLAIFENQLLKPIIDPIYGDMGLKDLRIKVKIQIKHLEDFDMGWKTFKYLFDKFYEAYPITYEQFRLGLVGQIKLMKKLIDFYVPRGASISDITSSVMAIGSKKLPSSNELFLVLSCNFADWFLCSTGESWKSCLSLNSTYQSAFWAGLPGLITDKNRAMIYITDGKQKSYHGIIVDKVISRIWCLLSEDNSLNLVKEYPLKIFTPELITKKFNIGAKDINKDFISKHPIDFLYTKQGYSIFPYLDKSKIKTVQKKHFIVGSEDGSGGLQGFKSSGAMYNESPYNCERGLEDLIKHKKEIGDFCGVQYSCEECGIGLSEDEIYFVNDDVVLCGACYMDHIHT